MLFRSGNYVSRECGVEMREDFGNGPRSTRALRQESKYESSTPATFDKYREAPATASAPKPVDGKFTMLHYGNADKINVGNN